MREQDKRKKEKNCRTKGKEKTHVIVRRKKRRENGEKRTDTRERRNECASVVYRYIVTIYMATQ